ncbi:MAG: endo alpha-1,4 polygalactosaminidase [Pirellulales bacterium]|nr:endo alpha-1,4 polygalactosaminidase [Pirellulales bacterium]
MSLRTPILAALACLVVASSASGDDPRWDSVASWAYQLNNYRDERLDELVATDFDLAVIDLARDGGDDFFTPGEIASLRAAGKVVLAYFEIGAIEDYRPEWNAVPTELKAGPVDGWPQEQYVKYWDERWWPVVRGRVERALAAGFDGAYLDMLTTYDEIPDSDVDHEERARRMVDLVVRLSKHAKSKNPAFKIVPQNCPELATWSFWDPASGKPHAKRYLAAIDGLGLESVFFIAHDKPAEAAWCRENRANAAAIKQAGKLVLGVDYAKQPANIAAAYRRQRELGFVPLASVRELDRVPAAMGTE